MERYIGDVDTNIVGPVIVQLDGQSVVKATRIFRIYGENAFLAKVSANFILVIRYAAKEM
jgi:hypothetical protein